MPGPRVGAVSRKQHRIENPRVGGSIPPQATKILQEPVHRDGLFRFWVCPMAQRLPPLSSAGPVSAWACGVPTGRDGGVPSALVCL